MCHDNDDVRNEQQIINNCKSRSSKNCIKHTTDTKPFLDDNNYDFFMILILNTLLIKIIQILIKNI